jgi:hypothetical protein
VLPGPRHQRNPRQYKGANRKNFVQFLKAEAVNRVVILGGVEAMSVQKEIPREPVPDTYKPLFAKEYTVRNNDSWERLANALHIHPWDLIDFNFPGMKAVWRIDAQRACRQINWYLFEYLGCEKSTDRYNYDFSSGLSRGRGVQKGGKIFLPIDGAAAVRRIDLPNAINSPGVAAGLNAARARLPTEARSLHPLELALAKVWFADSLVYEDIYVSDAEGAGGRSFTIALPLEKRWIVVLNLGPKGFNDPVSSDKAALIHQLAHAWQSQHHPLPWQFMGNSYQCQREAAEATIRTGRNASAFAYVPGGFSQYYAAEQVAQQLQDRFYPPGGVRPGIPFYYYVRRMPPGSKSHDNIQSLALKGYEYQDTPYVVWHPA